MPSHRITDGGGAPTGAELHRPLPAEDSPSPVLSLIVPAYNSGRTIERCLRALNQQQTSTSFEVIVVDSGSDDTLDKTRAILPQARVIGLERRVGPGAARNVGASVARGEILAFIDSDAYAAPDWVSAAVAAIGAGADIVCGVMGNANAGSRIARAEELLMFNEFLTGTRPGPRWFAVSANMAVRRELFERVGGFPETRAAEDVIFSRRAIQHDARILFDPRLRVLHENRTELMPFLRNQFLLGDFTARARRLVPFADTSHYAVFLALLPLALPAKLAKIVLRLARHNPRHLKRLGRDFPCFFAGLTCYSAGMVRGAVRGVDGGSR